jgi:hypothetical protein
MFDIVSTTLSAAVANGGTFTVSYPTGRNAGNYNAIGHKLSAMQTIFNCPKDFTVAFGASSITVTYNGSTTIPVGTQVDLQFDRPGADDNSPGSARVNAQVVRGGAYVMDLGSPQTADADGYVASQSVSSGVAAVINGALASNGVGYADTPRNVVAAWTGSAVMTVTGTDCDGNTVVEKSASGTSHTGLKAFKTVTSVTWNASVTGATVGTGNKIGLPFFIPDASYVLTELMNGVALPRYPGKVVIPWEIEQTELLAGTAEDLIAPCAGYIDNLRTNVQAAITTGGTIAAAINGGSAIAGLTQTIANSATKGTRQSTTPTTFHGSDSLVAAGDRITLTPASFATAGQVNGVLELTPTAAGSLYGTLVAGVTSAATGTTGDTRGTYTPAVTPDGTKGYQLVVLGIDPGNRGATQYTG